MDYPGIPKPTEAHPSDAVCASHVHVGAPESRSPGCRKSKHRNGSQEKELAGTDGDRHELLRAAAALQLLVRGVHDTCPTTLSMTVHPKP